ncbi:MAG: hypothetical protein Q9226_006083 [Calogaya cf. arnoldii]
MATSTSKEPQSQYRHYMPQSLLRNYAVHKDGYQPSTEKKGKGKSTPPQNLDLLDLKLGELKQTSLNSYFGLQDMYRDFDKTNTDQHKLEKQLSRLEEEASQILHTVKTRFEAGKTEIQLSRKEKGKLRKFLFIMLYRDTLYSHYNKSKEEHDDVDREDMLQYMEQKGFKQPRDVWFANTSVFLNADIDVNNANPLDHERTKELLQTMKAKLESQAYPPDAAWFLTNIQGQSMHFCTPNAKEDEFLMTQNTYSE